MVPFSFGIENIEMFFITSLLFKMLNIYQYHSLNNYIALPSRTTSTTTTTTPVTTPITPTIRPYINMTCADNPCNGHECFNETDNGLSFRCHCPFPTVAPRCSMGEYWVIQYAFVKWNFFWVDSFPFSPFIYNLTKKTPNRCDFRKAGTIFPVP